MPDEDIAIQAEIERMLASGEITAPIWRWPLLRPYGRFSGEERVRGWQLSRLAIQLGYLGEPRNCSICRTSEGKLERHNEDYSRPVLSKPICRSCHRRLHRRFRYPEQWERFIAVRGNGSKWFEHLDA